MSPPKPSSASLRGGIPSSCLTQLLVLLLLLLSFNDFCGISSSSSSSSNNDNYYYHGFYQLAHAYPQPQPQLAPQSAAAAAVMRETAAAAAAAAASSHTNTSTRNTTYITLDETINRKAQFPHPANDPFYTSPPQGELSSVPNGHVVRSRPFTSRYNVDNLASSHQFYYRTNDQNDTAVGTVGVVFAPKTRAAGPPKVLVYSIPEDAVNINCANSYIWLKGANIWDAATNELVMAWGLSKGFYVVNTDAYGPRGLFLVGKMEGHAALDGTLAAMQLHHLNTKSTRVAYYGYSGAAYTTVWATALAASYAPQLNIVGAAHGGTPVDLIQTVHSVNNTDEVELALWGMMGIARGYPEVQKEMDAILTRKGRQVLYKLYYMCSYGANFTTVFTGSMNEIFKSNPLEQPSLLAATREQSLLHPVSGEMSVPKFPRYIFNGKGDTVIPFNAINEYVTKQCARGADIRFTGLPLLDHEPTKFVGELSGWIFVEGALNGKLNHKSCGSSFPTPILGGPFSDIYLGPRLTLTAWKSFITT